MTRWFTRLADKRFLLFAVMSLGAVGLTIQAPKTFSRQPRPEFKSALAALAAQSTPETGYVVEDAKVVYDGQGPVVDGNGFTAPGNVNAPDLGAANAIAADQQKKGKGMGKGGGGGGVYKSTITPQWFANNSRFWYRNDTKDKTKDFVLVVVEKGTRQPAFDHEKLADGLSKVTGEKYEAAKLPFQTIEFVDVDKAVRFGVDGKFWQCDLASYVCTASATGPKAEIDPPQDQGELPRDFSENSYDALPPSEMSPEEIVEQQKKGQGQGQGMKDKKGQLIKSGGKKGSGNPGEARSKDGNWTAFVRNYNVWLRSKDGKETQITDSGMEGNAFTYLAWADDSKALVTYRTVPGDVKSVYLIETSPTNQFPAQAWERPYARAMDKFPTGEMWLVDVGSLKANKVEVEVLDMSRYGGGMEYPRLRWSKDHSHFTFEKRDRGYQRFRVIEVDARTGKTRNLLDEKADVMINHYGDGAKNDTFFLQYLDNTGEMLYLSEMDGWKHLYLIDAKEGKIKNQITKGEWVVRKIMSVDVAKRQIWFRASGKNADQDPYLVHYYRVNFDGTGLVALTDGNGNHDITYSPDNKFIIDTYSRLDMPPVHELRRVSDGTKVCDLEKADASELVASGWKPVEVFVAKGRDGKTDIWGYVVRPKNFDPNKKYPVIEYIYAGPHSNHVPKTFSAYPEGLQALADLGFILVRIDGMGTMNRSRAFHDVCWKNLKDAGFPDRILWMKALASKYAYVDITRVGIYGTSAGGQNAMGAVLFHPEFYKVAVAACGCHDNRLDKASWNESWMGLYGPHYEDNSNVTHAKNLQGRLLLIVGELDTNVPPESTYRCVDALIKAGKDFDLIVVPGADHSNGGAHGTRRRNDFFLQHLLGVPQPNHNAPGAMGMGKGKKGKGGEE